MTTYSFDPSVPASSHTPAQDQPTMQTNNQSIQDLIGVDHVTFEVANGGTHLQQTYYSNQSPLIGAALAIAYPGTRPSGYANSTGGSETNTYLVNQLGTLPCSIIKAGGTFATTSTSGAISFQSSFNCSAISSNGSGTYTITLAGVTTGNNIIVSISRSVGLAPNWSYTNPTLTISSAGTNGSLVSFIILQV